MVIIRVLFTIVNSHNYISINLTVGPQYLLDREEKKERERDTKVMLVE